MAQHAQSNSSTQGTIDSIRSLVRTNTRQWRRLLIFEGLGLAVAAVLAYFWTVVLLDSLLRFPVIARLAAGLGLLVGLVWLGVWLTRRWRGLKLTEDQVAIAIERNTPNSVSNRLINALQIGRDERYQSHDLAGALIKDNWRQLNTVRLEHARAMRPAVIRIIAAALAVAVGLGLWLWRPATFTNAASRILMPFAAIDPLYDTILSVSPGNAEVTDGELTVIVKLRGEPIDQLTILRNVDGKRTSIHVPIKVGQGEAHYTFTRIDRSFDYAVQGGDYTSRFYHVAVPRATRLELMRAELNYPAYAARKPQTVETTGSIEALQGTRAKVQFSLDQKVESADLILFNHNGIETRQKLTLADKRTATGEILLGDQVEYRLETVQGGRAPQRGRPYAIRPLPDKAPTVELLGIARHTEVGITETLALHVHATDDVGLDKVELVMRRVTPSAPQPAEDAEAWEVVKAWPGENKADVTSDASLFMLELSAAEGDRMQLALRAADSDPDKAGKWSISASHSLVVGGEGVSLQLAYEQILASESQITQLIKDEQDLIRKCKMWQAKFRPDSGLRWDDAATLKTMHDAAKEMATWQAARRDHASRAARDMVQEAGTVRFGLGMLADTEFERVVRIMEAIQERDEPRGLIEGLTDAQSTAQRIIESLSEQLDQYVQFRSQWELTHMIAFTKMIADRQTKMAEQSRTLLEVQDEPRIADLRRQSSERRQKKLGELTGLAATAFSGLSGKVNADQPILGKAFGIAATGLTEKELVAALADAVMQVGAARWSQAAMAQTLAGEKLTAIHAALRVAQTEAAKAAMNELSELAKSDAELQKDIDELLEGSLEQLLSGNPEDVPIDEIIRMHKMAEDAKKKHELNTDRALAEDYKWDDSMMGLLSGGPPEKPDFSVLKLAEKPSGERSFPDSSDLQGNKMELALIEDQYEDLVGDLLEEADDINDKFETYNLNAQGQGVEEGDIGKQAGDINSVSAAAPTGNMKPPTNNFGGASRTGRGGARAHGMVVGNESINRRGRDEAQEGQEKVADQAGLLKEVMSDDPMKDTSTGIGGKKVDSDDTHFSIKDSGKWTDDIVGRMDKAQKVQKIVERQDGSFSAEMAEQLRDLTSDQEQLIERLKTIRKDLKNLYLPTDHLDRSIEEISSNLDALKEAPTAEVFRKQQQAIDRLRATMRVFRAAKSDYRPSLPREQRIRGRILDTPQRAPSPEYEQAVKQYYEMLSTQ